ncbi:phosphonate ABC transporter, permease protein PhnE [Paenibacillus crassostreae]|uniref:Phosphonate ABC transporter permease n=1 Tax=Paenibacillus crassostreae TaxID=1763538 RepID=A0A167AFX8_9BACL|nr:phosphonate ABC transporter, permease protein PhnE [Paenibacillus crassostreae]AOZ92257.1 phosphonate ABC transporter, permease protein PhnE [Paenibacillus crassostreae]OAB70974.1 phosphonate ABC transporter permease [Paenibacillus crassostreae]
MLTKLFPPKTIELPNGKVVIQKRSMTPIILLVFIVLIYLSVQITDFDLQRLLKRINQFFVIINEMIPPTWAYMPKLWEPLIATIKMSLFGSALGAICALPIAMLAASNINRSRWIPSVTKFILSILRTLPTLVVALIATFIFGLGTMAGTVAIFLFTISYIGKLLYEQIENAEMGAYEAMNAMGLTTIQSFRYAIFPQVLPNYLSTSLFCFEGNVRYASILGYVGAGGIGLLLAESLGWRNYANVGMILLMLVCTVFVIETISEYFRKKLM